MATRCCFFLRLPAVERVPDHLPTRLTSLPCARQLLDTGCGAYVQFEGWVRDHNEGQQVLRLEYEVYEPLAIKEGQRIIDEAMAAVRRAPGRRDPPQRDAGTDRCRGDRRRRPRPIAAKPSRLPLHHRPGQVASAHLEERALRQWQGGVGQLPALRRGGSPARTIGTRFDRVSKMPQQELTTLR